MASDKERSKLRELAQLDVDAIGLYDAAIQRITVPLVREKLSEFRVDHVRHVQDLNTEILKLGGEQVDGSPDAKGTLLRGFTAVTSMMGTQAALFAMARNEELTNHSYQSALKGADWTAEVRSLIERNYADERRHLAWIKQASKEKFWEAESGAEGRT
jgi:uncharacterized protein (TIGR02284 family)